MEVSAEILDNCKEFAIKNHPRIQKKCLCILVFYESSVKISILLIFPQKEKDANCYDFF